MDVTTAKIEILLVEDNLGDVLLTREALEQAAVHHHLSVVHDGVEAMDFLRRTGRHTCAPRVNLILLDLNLPRMGGRDVVAEIRCDADLSKIPLVVVTSSQQDQDVLNGMDPQRCLYVVKPPVFPELVEIMRRIEAFWLSTSTAGMA